jgi:hypothetical protein
MAYTVPMKLDATSASVAIGDAVVTVAGGGLDNTITVKKLNGVLLAGSKFAGVAHTTGSAGGSVEVQQVGLVPSTITGLNAAAPPLRSLVRVKRTTGRLERLSGTSPLEKGDIVIGVADQYGNVMLLDHDSGVYDVRDFGAVGDGITDDAPAFAVAIAAMGGGSGRAADGTVLKIPAGTYKCSDDIHVYKQCTIQGATASTGNGGTIIQFDAGKSMIFWHQGSPFGGIATGTAVRDLGIHSTKVIGANDAWAPNRELSEFCVNQALKNVFALIQTLNTQNSEHSPEHALLSGHKNAAGKWQQQPRLSRVYPVSRSQRPPRKGTFGGLSVQRASRSRSVGRIRAG